MIKFETHQISKWTKAPLERLSVPELIYRYMTDQQTKEIQSTYDKVQKIIKADKDNGQVDPNTLPETRKLNGNSMMVRGKRVTLSPQTTLNGTRGQIKLLFPAFFPSAIFDGKGITQQNVIDHTGVFHLDYDHIHGGSEAVERIMNIIFDVEGVFLAFVSPSGDGIKVFIDTDFTLPEGTTPKAAAIMHKKAYSYVADLINGKINISLSKADQIVYDRKCSDINRKCFVPYRVGEREILYRDPKPYNKVHVPEEFTTKVPEVTEVLVEPSILHIPREIRMSIGTAKSYADDRLPEGKVRGSEGTRHGWYVDYFKACYLFGVPDEEAMESAAVWKSQKEMVDIQEWISDSDMVRGSWTLNPITSLEIQYNDEDVVEFSGKYFAAVNEEHDNSSVINAIHKMMDKHSMVELIAPTGSGKTYFCIQQLAKQQLAEGKTMVHALPYVLLAEQVYEDYLHSDIPNSEIALAVGSSKEDCRGDQENASIIICTYDKLVKSEALQLKANDLLIADESHSFVMDADFRAYVMTRTMQVAQTVTKFLGLSATPSAFMEKEGFHRLKLETKATPEIPAKYFKYSTEIGRDIALGNLLKKDDRKHLILFNNKVKGKELAATLSKTLDEKVGWLDADTKTSTEYNALKSESRLVHRVTMGTNSIAAGINVKEEDTVVCHVLYNRESEQTLVQFFARPRNGSEAIVWIPEDKKEEDENKEEKPKPGAWIFDAMFRTSQKICHALNPDTGEWVLKRMKTARVKGDKLDFIERTDTDTQNQGINYRPSFIKIAKYVIDSIYKSLPAYEILDHIEKKYPHIRKGEDINAVDIGAYDEERHRMTKQELVETRHKAEKIMKVLMSVDPILAASLALPTDTDHGDEQLKELFDRYVMTDFSESAIEAAKTYIPEVLITDTQRKVAGAFRDLMSIHAPIEVIERMADAGELDKIHTDILLKRWSGLAMDKYPEYSRELDKVKREGLEILTCKVIDSWCKSSEEVTNLEVSQILDRVNSRIDKQRFGKVGLTRVGLTQILNIYYGVRMYKGYPGGTPKKEIPVRKFQRGILVGEEQKLTPAGQGFAKILGTEPIPFSEALRRLKEVGYVNSEGYLTDISGLTGKAISSRKKLKDALHNVIAIDLVEQRMTAYTEDGKIETEQKNSKEDKVYLVDVTPSYTYLSNDRSFYGADIHGWIDKVVERQKPSHIKTLDLEGKLDIGDILADFKDWYRVDRLTEVEIMKTIAENYEDIYALMLDSDDEENYKTYRAYIKELRSKHSIKGIQEDHTDILEEILANS